MNGCLLDTNIISELYKGDRAAARVRSWHNRAGGRRHFLSVLVLGEIRRGIELLGLKDARAAQNLEKRWRATEIEYAGRILPVTAEICDLWGRLPVRQRLPEVDGLLAATALHHKLTLVTRNKRDFARSGVACFDPFVD